MSKMNEKQVIWQAGNFFPSFSPSLYPTTLPGFSIWNTSLSIPSPFPSCLLKLTPAVFRSQFQVFLKKPSLTIDWLGLFLCVLLISSSYPCEVCFLYVVLCNKSPQMQQLKTTKFLFSQFLCLRYPGHSAQELRLRSGCWPAVSSSGDLTRENQASRLPQLVGRICFLAAVELKFLFLSQLQVGTYSQLKSLPCGPLQHGVVALQGQQGIC